MPRNGKETRAEKSKGKDVLSRCWQRGGWSFVEIRAKGQRYLKQTICALLSDYFHMYYLWDSPRSGVLLLA